MDVIHDCVAGLDVRKDTVVARVRAMSGNKATRECRSFGTTTDGLSALLEWLISSKVSAAAMEATGVYWLPAWNISSEGAFELVLANAAYDQGGSRPQDRHERRDVDRRSRRARLDQGELRSRPGDA